MCTITNLRELYQPMKPFGENQNLLPSIPTFMHTCTYAWKIMLAVFRHLDNWCNVNVSVVGEAA